MLAPIKQSRMRWGHFMLNERLNQLSLSSDVACHQK
ncbi:hypothetical protein GKA53_03920 [Vibrio parahaemolyticus]|nr:hypothetical protein [Vibrio parahaemolyticus]EGQ8849851.1 hypothetical protein [Vibrio parahaemolyticus]EGQ8854042.1 hypothetical protein [Vibrio parahaemolyticus]EGQ8873288.1 hypothetical protein [Vibrio parahaemolyticus]EGQ8993002.1 hypothetical protein [Vibrio parahaemolyticus]